MNATQQLLDSLALWFGDGNPVSDYRLAKDYFHVATSKLSEYRTGKRTFADERVLEICESIWPGDDAKKRYWLVQIHADREQNVQVRSVWQQIARQVAVVALAVGIGAFGGAPAQATASVSAANGMHRDMYYAKWRRRLRRLLRRGSHLQHPHPGGSDRWRYCFSPLG